MSLCTESKLLCLVCTLYCCLHVAHLHAPEVPVEVHLCKSDLVVAVERFLLDLDLGGDKLVLDLNLEAGRAGFQSTDTVHDQVDEWIRLLESGDVLLELRETLVDGMGGAVMVAPAEERAGEGERVAAARRMMADAMVKQTLSLT